MPIPKVYAKIGQDAIASYNYTDISNGTGVVYFQGFNSATSGAAVNLLTPADALLSGAATHLLGTITKNSDDIETEILSGGAYQAGLAFDLTTFNKPQIIKGSANAWFSWKWGADLNDTIYFDLKFIKVAADGTFTIFGSGSSELWTSPGGAIIKTYGVKVDLTETHFKVGDKLRFYISPRIYDSGTVYIGHDPLNRDGTQITPATTYPTRMDIYVPFKLDV